MRRGDGRRDFESGEAARGRRKIGERKIKNSMLQKLKHAAPGPTLSWSVPIGGSTGRAIWLAWGPAIKPVLRRRAKWQMELPTRESDPVVLAP